ncbi:MAG: RNA methyltransferase [Bacillota bacterium]|nr:RNA methyltransferase [Bacillota bacterium]
MITSFNNSRIKQLVTLREKSRARNKEGLFLAEGLKMFEEAPIERLREVYCSQSFAELLKKKDPEQGTEDKAVEAPKQDENRLKRIQAKLEHCREKGIVIEILGDEVFKKASDTQTPQGILFVMEQFSYSLTDMLTRAEQIWRTESRPPLFLLLEDIQDPGNLGTMLRTGEGAGVSGVIMSKGTADIYNPKTIRSTMGSLYRVPHLYVEDLGEAIRRLKEHEITVYAAHLKGTQFYDRVAYQGGSAFLIGNEGKGLKKETADQADIYIKIPMKGKLESLNAAVAAALLLYQAAGSHRG